MRLTLRTLLAWLDVLLGPEEQRSLGDRVAASGLATGLTQRIVSAVGRADLGAPRIDSWGTDDDANIVADYLDNRLSNDQLEWFERSCIHSEPRLAEVADCHGALAELSRLGDDGGIVLAPSDRTNDRLKHMVHQTLSHRGERPRASATRGAEGSAAGSGGTSAGHSGEPKDHSVARSAAAAALRPAGAPFPRTSFRHGSAAANSPAVETDDASATRQPKTFGTARRRQLSDRLPATVALGLLLASGGAAVMWLNFGGPGGEPRRAAIQGFVTFDGAPLDEGVVVLMPAEGTKGPTAGSAVAKGGFSIAAAGGPAVGRYRVEVRALRKTGRRVKAVVAVGGQKEREEFEQFIPAKYNTASELEVEIKPGRNTMTLQLESPPPPPAKPGAAAKPPRIVAGRPGIPAARVVAANRPG